MLPKRYGRGGGGTHFKIIFYHNLLQKTVPVIVWKFKPLVLDSSCSLDKVKLHNYHMIKLNILQGELIS